VQCAVQEAIDEDLSRSLNLDAALARVWASENLLG
jgi:hypothetical protein